jgi:hypothetical protein
MASVCMSRILRASLFYHYYLYRIAGLLPFNYNVKKKQFVTSPIALAYSLLCTLLVIFYHPKSIDYFLTSIQLTRIKVKDRQITYVFYKSMNLLMVSFYVLNICYRNGVRKVLNQTIKYYSEVIVEGSVTQLNLKSWIMFNALQSFAIHVVYVIFMMNFPNTMTDFNPENVLQGLITIVPFGFWTLFLNTYTNVFTVLLLRIRHVNESIEGAISESLYEASTLPDKLQASLFILQKVRECLELTINSMSHFLVSLFGIMFGCLINQV